MADYQDRENFPLDGRKLLMLSILSGLVWLLLGNLVIHFFQEKTLADIFFRGSHILVQVGIGLATGALIGLAGIAMIRLPSFKKILDEYAIIRQVRELSMSPAQMVYVSLIAGISEEILFRGALQPVIGIWWTSILFIGVHGYIRLRTITHVLYTLFTFLLSTILGLLFIYFGLPAAISAHFIYDVVVLYDINRDTEKEKVQDNSTDK